MEVPNPVGNPAAVEVLWRRAKGKQCLKHRAQPAHMQRARESHSVLEQHVWADACKLAPLTRSPPVPAYTATQHHATNHHHLTAHATQIKHPDAWAQAAMKKSSSIPHKYKVRDYTGCGGSYRKSRSVVVTGNPGAAEGWAHLGATDGTAFDDDMEEARGLGSPAADEEPPVAGDCWPEYVAEPPLGDD